MPEPTLLDPKNTTPDQFIQGLPEAIRAQAVPTELQTHPAFKDIKDMSGLVKSYLHAQSFVGKRFELPGENATPEEINTFYKNLGRPEKPEDYSFKDDGLPKEIYGREEILKSMRAVMHQNGLTKKQAEAVFDAYTQTMNKHVEQLGVQEKERKTQAVEQLKKDFGADLDKKVNMARAVVNKFGGDEFKEYLNKSGLGDNPQLIRMFAKLAEAMGNDQMLSGTGDAGSGSAAEALQKLRAMEADPEVVKSLMDRSHAAHKKNTEERSRLFALAYPDEQKN